MHLTLSFSQYINEMIGELFIAHDMPEQQPVSFLKGLFGVGARSLDREELCKLPSFSIVITVRQFDFTYFSHNKHTKMHSW